MFAMENPTKKRFFFASQYEEMTKLQRSKTEQNTSLWFYVFLTLYSSQNQSSKEIAYRLHYQNKYKIKMVDLELNNNKS